MEKSFISAVKNRRSYYSISNQAGISQPQIKKIVEDAVTYSPSAFDSQSARVALLFGKHHDKLWNIVLETLRKRVPPEKFQKTEDKIGTFAAGHATVLFFEDTDIVKGLQEKFPSYGDNFPVWAQQSNGMLQFVVWTALEEEGMGASLQHYNPIIDDAVKQEWQIPDAWQLISQMPFGLPTAQPEEKSNSPIENRVKVFD